MASYFDETKLSLNIGKSGYMVINGKNVLTCDLVLNNGKIQYVTSVILRLLFPLTC